MLLLYAGQPEAEAESRPVSCPGNLCWRWNLQFSSFGVLRDFLHHFTCQNFYPFGRDLRLSRTSGMSSLRISMGESSCCSCRTFGGGRGLQTRGLRLSCKARLTTNENLETSITASSTGGRKVAVLTWERGIWGFYVSRVNSTLHCKFPNI